jgi:hypothetical protein
VWCGVTEYDPGELFSVLDGVDPAALAVALSLLHPNDALLVAALLVAARLGVEMNDARREWRRTMREVSHQIRLATTLAERVVEAGGLTRKRARGGMRSDDRHLYEQVVDRAESLGLIRLADGGGLLPPLKAV